MTVGSPDAPGAPPAAPAAELNALVPEVYAALRHIARLHLRRQRRGATLDTSAVVHEAYLKLAAGRAGWNDRPHFLALASTAMRHLLVDAARRKCADKRGAGVAPLPLDPGLDAAAPGPDAIDIQALDQALQRLARLDPQLEHIVECRFFAGLSVAETAAALNRSVRSVERDWARARAHLHAALCP